MWLFWEKTGTNPSMLVKMVLNRRNWLKLVQNDLNCTKYSTSLIFKSLYMLRFTHFLCVQFWFVKYSLRKPCVLSHVWTDGWRKKNSLGCDWENPERPIQRITGGRLRVTGVSSHLRVNADTSKWRTSSWSIMVVVSGSETLSNSSITRFLPGEAFLQSIPLPC